MALSIHEIRRQFTILSRTIDNRPFVYLDSAATAQKPEAVIEAMATHERKSNANVHRGMHPLAEDATVAYEAARESVSHFLHAEDQSEIVFTKSCTESLNLVAKSWGRANLKAGDTVVLSILEHHSNIVPWFQLKEELGIRIQWIDIDRGGNIAMDQLHTALAGGTVKLVSITGLSNVLGTLPDLSAIVAASHDAGALVCIDAAQLVAHTKIDVAKLDCDFLAFSGHKLYGPTGIGVLYAKRKILESMPPFLGGGMMIRDVTIQGFTPADSPQRFEAGTPPITEAVGLRAAIDWISQFSWKDIEEHETSLMRAAIETLSRIKELTILTLLQAKSYQLKAGCISFVVDGIHPHDLTEIIGRRGVCMRAGHHCCEPLHTRLGITASTRLSIGIYNTVEEIRSIKPIIEEAIKKLT